MKRLLFQHRMLSAAALAAFFLAGSLHAQEPPQTRGNRPKRKTAAFPLPGGSPDWAFGIPDRLDDLEKRFPPPEGRQPGAGEPP